MKKILLYSISLILGLILSQVVPVWIDGETYILFKDLMTNLMYVCLAFVMINVGREFELDKSRWRSYRDDYFIAMGTAALPWILVALYYIFVLLPPDYFGNGTAWKESLLLSRFAAPTSAGILFTMLIVSGLKRSWIYKKIQVLAIFDDLDTVLLMIPLQILMVKLYWQMGAMVAIILVLLIFGWRKMSNYGFPQEWWNILLYSFILLGFTWALNKFFNVHIEILLPAFILGMVIRHKESHRPEKQVVAATISVIFMLLVGLSMPFFGSLGSSDVADFSEKSFSILGSQPLPSVTSLAFHVLIVTLLANIGKLVPLFFYRDRLIEERLAISVGMFVRGEVGAGVIFIAISYNIGGPALIISILTLALNLMLTGFFITIVKKLAFKVQKNKCNSQR
ncbi:MAG: hypothetical protein FWH18_12835 [Marinilabiliaceae bacterium]|nr:hypothetical protein [Marinilabiliaceae bacterium]